MFYSNLQRICDQNGLKITPIVKECGGSAGKISAWKKGAVPNSDIVVKLAMRLNVSTDFLLLGEEAIQKNTPVHLSENDVLLNYRILDKQGKIAVSSILTCMVNKVDQPEQAKPKKAPPVVDIDDRPMRHILYFDQPASAGDGLTLDHEEYDFIEVPEGEVPEKTGFAVRISGDSMVPDFFDGDTVFVRQGIMVENGEIGVFVLNDEAYIKRLSKTDEGTSLVSLNEKYKPIVINEYDVLRCFGRVVGKLPKDDV